MNMFLAIRAKIGRIRNPVLTPTSGRFVLKTALAAFNFSSASKSTRGA